MAALTPLQALAQLRGSPGFVLPDGAGGDYVLISGMASYSSDGGATQYAPDMLEHADVAGAPAGSAYQLYDMNGSRIGGGTVQAGSMFAEFIKGAALLAGAAIGAGALLGGTSAAAAGGSGAFVGEGVASGVPAWDAAAGLSSSEVASVAAAGGADGWELTNAAVMGGPGTDLAGITAAGTGATVLPGAAAAAGASGLAGSAGGLASTVAKVAGAGASVLGAVTRATMRTPTVQPGITATPVRVAGASNNSGWLLMAAAALGLVALVKG